MCNLHACNLGCLLADDMGLGKTMQALAAAISALRRKPDATAVHPAIVVCPASVVHHWIGECEKFFGSSRFGNDDLSSPPSPASSSSSLNLLATPPLLKPVALQGSVKERKEALDSVRSGVCNVLIVPYSQLTSSFARTHLFGLDGDKPGFTAGTATSHSPAIQWSIAILDEGHVI